MMTEYDQKAKICDILNGVDFACGRANCASCPWLAKGYEECKNAKKAAILVKKAVVDKEYKDWWESHIRQDIRFAKEEGFTPDCSPYYIALQYKQNAEMLGRRLEQEKRASVQKACELLDYLLDGAIEREDDGGFVTVTILKSKFETLKKDYANGIDGRKSDETN